MAVLARVLGIGLVATAAFALLMMGDDGEGGANIGAGLAVFAVVAVGSFGWALLDGLGRTGAPDPEGASDETATLRPLLVRWLLVSVLLVVLVQALRGAGSDEGWVDTEPSTLLFLLLVAACPALAGAMLGWAVRGAQAGSNRPPVTR